jgi:REP element-mobilizing transposase RayT
MSERIFKSHNVSIRIYHLVCPAKYRKVVFDPEVDAVLRDICIEISDCYEIRLSEIGRHRDHVHFLVQSVLTYSPKRLVRLIKSLTAREEFKRVPSVKRQLWGGQFWSDGYFVATVGQLVSEEVVRQYVQKQGTQADYKQLHHEQLTLL